jgi:hypothetical protein
MFSGRKNRFLNVILHQNVFKFFSFLRSSKNEAQLRQETHFSKRKMVADFASTKLSDQLLADSTKQLYKQFPKRTINVYK